MRTAAVAGQGDASVLPVLEVSAVVQRSTNTVEDGRTFGATGEESRLGSLEVGNGDEPALVEGGVVQRVELELFRVVGLFSC